MMRKTCGRLLCLLLLAEPVSAEIVLAPLFQDGAVLQREKKVPVWGRATAGKEVTVEFSGQTKTTTADAAGRWQVSLDPLHADAHGQTLSVTEAGSPATEIGDILVGEVWLCSGQSNMEFGVNNTPPNEQAIAKEGTVELLRLFQVPRKVSNVRQETVDAKWTHASPEAAMNFSAVGYFFGKMLSEKLHVPVGMIHSSWGGSRIEPWWAEEGLAEVPELAEQHQERLAKTPGFPAYDAAFKKYVSDLRSWTDDADKALAHHFPVPEMPTGPALLKAGSGEETGTYQAMIHPLVPYALRGFLWYQGESNSSEGMAYTLKQKALIAGWRKQFQAPDAPFLYVQIAPYFYGDNRDQDIPQFWTAQQACLEVPHTGMAVINDIGNPKDIHPKRKMEVARRLLLWAMKDSYGDQDTVVSGPLYSGYEVKGNTVEIHFEHTGGGLATRDGKAPTLFEIAGVTADYKPATATISDDGTKIIVSSPDVPHPDRVRFAWSQIAEPNLMNKEGLPAGAFNTHWPVDPTLGTNLLKGKPHQSSNRNQWGWDGGLTDGVWGDHSPSAYATDNSKDFPKSVTLDMGSVEAVQTVVFGTPAVGSTKTVAISVSKDGKEFTEVGQHDFSPHKAERAEIRFEPKDIQFIRASFIAQQSQQQDNYDIHFGFLSEIEAYGPPAKH
ncbi:hypothetical protein JIN85_11180 [Luteolibacter pohnpeiensis]|uniref:Sialate O-acetylesterase domain-containing protein n=1 Tax=Luteolibacter pohnpeiensis TaxID=454153 RepID=A0A934VRA2_9BACT|nr:sialate O-acetylesterase [Luteolibacter pohnpeiensis]MBK1882981.1 hypothetical protein [Luteolibacter pohnpeiensis]